MKIGIVTLSASDNCGSLLQAYALQEVLKKRYPCTVELIDLKTPQSDAVYEMFPVGFWKHPKKTLFTLRYFNSIKKQKQGYQIFRENYLNMSLIQYHNEKEISMIKGQYDILISGSDQVWNVYMSDFSPAFYLPWDDSARKIAYAASLGGTTEIDNELIDKLKKWLMNYYSISVREESGKKTIERIIDKNVELTLDPTLLLSNEDWNSIIEMPLINEEYIFYYSWSYPDERMNRIVEKFAKENQLPVYVINSSKWYKYRPEKFGFKLHKESGPLVFLNLMKNAKYVFVQSFHGVVFANLLHKRFFFLNENGEDKVDFRTKNIVELLEEEAQVISEYADIEQALNTELHFSNEKFKERISSSLCFLDRSILDD